jgi:mRNA interferase RelE/StbE
MGRYRLVFEESVARDLRDSPKRDVALILTSFEALSEDPRPPGCEKLSGRQRYRVRRGAYRIIYEIEDSALMVAVVKVEHGRVVYRGNSTS